MLCENPTLCYSCCDFILIHLQHPGGDLGTDRSVWVLLGTIHLTRFSEWKHFSAPTCLPSLWGFSILAPVVCCSVPVACHRGGCPEPNGICSLQGHRWGNWKKGSQNLFTALVFCRKMGTARWSCLSGVETYSVASPAHAQLCFITTLPGAGFSVVLGMLLAR